MILLKNQKIIEPTGDSQTIQKIAPNDLLECVKDDQKVDAYIVKDMLKQLGEHLEPGKYYLRYDRDPIDKQSDDLYTDGIKYRIDLVPIKVIKVEDLN